MKLKPLKAEALRQAQIAMIRGEITLIEGQLKTPRDAIALTQVLANLEDSHFSHPFYWAGFSLVGNPF